MKDFLMEWDLGHCLLGLQSVMEDSFKVFRPNFLHLKEGLHLSLLIIPNQVSQYSSFYCDSNLMVSG